MAILSQLSGVFQAVLQLVLTVVGFFSAIFRWFLSILGLLPIIIGLTLLSVAGFFIAQNSALVLENVVAGQGILGAAYDATFGPFLNFFRQIYNYLICWWNLITTYPQELVREVIIPIAKSCGILPTIRNYFLFLRAYFTELADFLFTAKWQDGKFEYADTCNAWIVFWQSWQDVLCCGCGDVCPFLRSQPAFIPPIIINPFAIFGSDQLADSQMCCAIGDTANGWLFFFQDVMLIIRSKVAPVYGEQRPTFKRSFDTFVNATSCLMRSTEAAVQRFWDNYVPYSFNFDQILCAFDKGLDVWLKSVSVLLKILLNYDLAIFQFYSHPFFRTEIRRDFIEILNLIGAPDAFANVTIAIPSYVNVSLPTPPVFLNNVTISHYYLGTDEFATMEGFPNPLYNETRFTDCFGQLLQRVFCDPQFNGTTCAQRWNGTILEYFNFECPNRAFWSVFADAGAFFFETLLHGKSANEFLIYSNIQPFTTSMKDDMISMIDCFSVFFYVVKEYGFAIGVAVREGFRFGICSFELYFRVVIGLATIPYYETYLPGLTNIVSDPNQEALIEALAFYEQIIIGIQTPFARAGRNIIDNTLTLVNSICFITNSAFHFPYAGCPTPCTPGQFDPLPTVLPHLVKKYDGSYTSFIDAIVPANSARHYISRISPIRTRSDGGNVAFSPLLIYDRMQAPGATGALVFAYEGIDAKLEQFVSTIRTLPTCNKQFAYGERNTCPSRHAVWNTWPKGHVDNEELAKYHPKALLPINASLLKPAPVGAAVCNECFDLCCFPRTVLVFFSHLSSFIARLLSNFVISRGGLGSPYFDGTGCNITTGAGTCLAKDLTILTADFMVRKVYLSTRYSEKC